MYLNKSKKIMFANQMGVFRRVDVRQKAFINGWTTTCKTKKQNKVSFSDVHFLNEAIKC